MSSQALFRTSFSDLRYSDDLCGGAAPSPKAYLCRWVILRLSGLTGLWDARTLPRGVLLPEHAGLGLSKPGNSW